MADPSAPARSFLLVFQDDAAPCISASDVLGLDDTKHAAAKAILNLATHTVASLKAAAAAAANPGSPAARWSAPVAAEGGVQQSWWRGPLLVGNGVDALLLVAPSVEAKAVALAGFAAAAAYAHAHGATHAGLSEEPGKRNKGHPLAIPAHHPVADFLHHFHHL
jgi:hypothetical protein